MTELVIMRGLPASGKTTWATRWVRKATRDDPRARLSRDDCRMSMFGDEEAVKYLSRQQLAGEMERTISRALEGQCEALLRAGVSVVIDATNLRAAHARTYATIAVNTGSTYRVVDMGTSVEECVFMDRIRSGMPGQLSVGEDAIRAMDARFRDRPEITPKTPKSVDVEPYVVDGQTVSAFIVDIDGTLAHMEDRDPYDYRRVHLDSIDPHVRELVNYLSENYVIILMSGRDETCHDATANWLHANDVTYDELHMRASGDNRADALVKYELFNEFVRDHYKVCGVIDDRRQVVEMWRKLGLKTYQVDFGEF